MVKPLLFTTETRRTQSPATRERIKIKHMININKLTGEVIGAAIEVHDHIH